MSKIMENLSGFIVATYVGQIFKDKGCAGVKTQTCINIAKRRSKIFLFTRIHKIYSLTDSQCINHELLAKRSKVGSLYLQGSNIKIVPDLNENGLIILSCNTVSKKNSFHYIRCFVVMVAQPNMLLPIESH